MRPPSSMWTWASIRPGMTTWPGSSAISRPPGRSRFRAEAASPTNAILPPVTASPRAALGLAAMVTTGPITTRSASLAQETPESPIQRVRPATRDRAHRLMFGSIQVMKPSRSIPLPRNPLIRLPRSLFVGRAKVEVDATFEAQDCALHRVRQERVYFATRDVAPRILAGKPDHESSAEADSGVAPRVRLHGAGLRHDVAR